MITDSDIDFHNPPDADHTYAETNWFCFYIPEEKLMGIIYTVSRRGVGVQSCDVSLYGALVDNRVETLYLDAQMALPCPPSLREYTTANGLSVKAHNIREYRVDYVGYDGMEIHFDFKGLMEPFDIHDPNHSPMAKTSVDEQHAGSGMGSGYGGHFDLTGTYKGELIWQGKTYPINCVETMDHSWGSRPEIFVPTMGWSHAHFGEDLAIHWINHWDPTKPVDQQQSLAHGYVMEDGVAYGLTDMKLNTHRVGSVIYGVELEVTDKRGKMFKAHGMSEVGGPWVCYVASNLYCAQCRWTLDGSDRVGYGLVAEINSMQALTRQHGRRWTQSSGHLTI